MVSYLAEILHSPILSKSDRAQLRRMHPSQSPPLAFYHFGVQFLSDHWDRDPDTQKNWMTVVAGMALMHPHTHRFDCGLGQALAHAGVSPARLERLLTATGDNRRTLVLRAARRLAAEQIACNWSDPARLLLAQNVAQSERVRCDIASDFYRHLPT